MTQALSSQALTTAQADSRSLAVLVVGVLLAVALAVVVERWRPAPPRLPEPDRPPSGLGRLVPVGAQVDQEVRRGLTALESWLAAQRRATP